MKKISKIVSAFVCLAMAVGVGVAIGSTGRDAEGVKAATGDVKLMFDSNAIVTASGYNSYENTDWTLNAGGNNVSAGWNKTAGNAKQVGDKFAIDTAVTSSTYGWVAATKSAISNVGKLTFVYTGGSGNGSGKLWLASSSNGTSYSKVNLTSGTQGSGCGSTNTTYTFEFDTISSAYYAIIVTGGTSGSAFRFDNVTAKLLEGAVSIPATAVAITGNDGTSLAPAETRQLGTTVTPSNSTDTITWSSSNNNIATVSSTGLVTAVADGTVTITARANASVAGTTSITVETPSSPYISPTKASTRGYTGNNETLTFTYGNLASTLGVTSSDTNIVTVGDPSTSAGSGSVQINFVGQGSTTVKFKDGSTELASVTVAVVQTINNVYAETSSENKSTLVFTDKYATQGGDADDGKTWVVTSDGTESNFDSTKGIHYGTSSAAVQYINLTSSDFTTGKITKVVVNASTASGVTATVAVNVGGEAFGGDAQSITTTATDYTFEGEVDADEIEVIVTKPSSATKAIYCKSVEVTYETSGTQQIANSASHMDAQRVAVAFANAFNDAMDDTENCTTGLSAAWATCTSAYNTFKSQAVALGEAEEAYAKNLVKYATVTEGWPESYPDEACIERMMKVYSVCVNEHDMTAFMSDLVSLAKVSNNSILGLDSTTAISIIVIISIISVTSIGALLVLRRRKEN